MSLKKCNRLFTAARCRHDVHVRLLCNQRRKSLECDRLRIDTEKTDDRPSSGRQFGARPKLDLRRKRLGPFRKRSAQHRLDARQQFFEIKRFGHIVIGAELESGQPVVLPSSSVVTAATGMYMTAAAAILRESANTRMSLSGVGARLLRPGLGRHRPALAIVTPAGTRSPHEIEGASHVQDEVSRRQLVCVRARARPARQYHALAVWPTRRTRGDRRRRGDPVGSSDSRISPSKPR